MDKGDHLIKQKANQARPYKPKADWDRMAAMLDAPVAPKKGTKFTFLGGFFLGAASIVILLSLFWLTNNFDKKESTIVENEKLEIPSKEEGIKHRENTAELKTSLSENPSTSQSIYKTEKNTSANGKNATLLSKPSVNFSESTKKHRQNFTSQYTQATTSHLTKKPLTSNPGQKTITESLGDNYKSNNLHSEKNRNNNELKAIASIEESNIASFASMEQNFDIMETNLDASSSGMQPIPALPVLALGNHRKWSVGLEFNGLVQPYTASPPIGFNQNPFIYRWHPGLAIVVNRKLNKRITASAKIGSDDAYYYEGYIPAGSLVEANFNELGNSVALIVGTNYWLEAGGKFKLRKKQNAVIDPFVRGAIGYVWSTADFLSIFDLDETQLSGDQRSSRLSARQNLNTFGSNPFLVNNNTYVDANGAVSTSADDFATYSVNNNLESFYRRKFVSVSTGIGTEVHLGSRWDLNIEANYLSRIGSILVGVPVPLESQELQAPPTPSLEFPENISFIQLGAGLAWKF
ncbi:MAG: hypothetical protein MRZ79_06095 [Bacteroidia bacterium]|nr:hypothetical protein [Bacteroidia bacterium]